MNKNSIVIIVIVALIALFVFNINEDITKEVLMYELDASLMENTSETNISRSQFTIEIEKKEDKTSIVTFTQVFSGVESADTFDQDAEHARKAFAEVLNSNKLIDLPFSYGYIEKNSELSVSIALVVDKDAYSVMGSDLVELFGGKANFKEGSLSYTAYSQYIQTLGFNKSDGL